MQISKKGSENTKIFGVGLNKTGTTTLGQCGKILGLATTSYNKKLLEDVVLRKDFSGIKDTVSQHDLFEDWPWPLIYKELDEMFPNSKFVLTTRITEEKWFKSLEKHALRTDPTNHCRKLAYGYSFPHKHKEEPLEFYRNHNSNVRKYFSGRENDFLEICWEKGDDISKFCNFLGVDTPDMDTPHANKAENHQVTKAHSFLNRLFSKF